MSKDISLPAGLVAFGKQFGATSLFADDGTNEVFSIMKKGAAAAAWGSTEQLLLLCNIVLPEDSCQRCQCLHTSTPF